MSVFFWMTATMAGDQVSVQRFMATENAPKARRALAMQLTVSMVVGATLGLVGLALLGYFQAHPELLPEAGTLNDQADKLFPHFIAFELPPVITGLVVSGLFAAAMSSIDSGVKLHHGGNHDRCNGPLRSQAGYGAGKRKLRAAVGLGDWCGGGAAEHVHGSYPGELSWR
jgi:hypothetical protein